MNVTGENKLIVTGVNEDVLSAEIKCYEAFKSQPEAICKGLDQLSVEDKCYSVFQYLIQRVKYKLDPIGDQYIKSPARLLSDGEGDCKSLTMFICCCLHCLGVSHKFRFVNFDGGRQFSHVYAVALDEKGNEIILDACELDKNGVPVFDYARPYSKKKDFTFYE